MAQSGIRVTGDDLNAVLNGTPVFRGVIIATTTKNNHDTATPFNDVTTDAAATAPTLEGKAILIQPDAACYILPVNVVTGTVTTANGILLAANERVVISMARGYGWLACVSVTGTTNCRIWELL